MERLVVVVAIALGLSLSTATKDQTDAGLDQHIPSKSKLPAQVGTPEYVNNEIIVKFRKDVADDVTRQLSRGVGAGGLSWPESLEKLNGKYKVKDVELLAKGFDEHRQWLAAVRKKDKGRLNTRERRVLDRLQRAPKNVTVPDIDRIYRIRIEPDGNDSVEEILQAYRGDPSVEYAELNYIVSALSAPNDPYYPVQWALNNTGQYYPISGGATDSGTPDADIDAPQAWDIYTGSSDIVVAVIDTGIDYTHGDLIGNLWTDANGHYGIDYVNNDNDPMDDFGHGTHCAGIIAARADNSTDTAGVCWNARIMAVKFLDASGSGNTGDAISAIYYAVNNGADVLSNSWGGGEYSQSLEEAINYAYSQGVITVAAAGNNNSSSPHYPAYYDHVISVASTNSDDYKAGTSNYGEWVDIAAPGVDILSLRAKDTDMYLGADGYNPGDRFIPFGDPDATMYIASGTSMACPHVSAACALLVSSRPSLTVDEVTDILLYETDPIASGICRSNGRLNLYKLLTPSTGRISLHRDYYSCTDEISIKLFDLDLKGENSHSVVAYTDACDVETVLLNKGVSSFVFTGTVQTGAGEPIIGDGTLQVLDGQTIYVTYEDANNGFGDIETVTQTAAVDCCGPGIFNVQTSNITSISAVVTFQTNENATSSLIYGLNCDGTNVLDDPILRTEHSFELLGLVPNTTYYFKIEARDELGNLTINNNDGLCYQFTTAPAPPPIYVPTDFPTIQQAIYSAVTGNTVIVKDGTYTGLNNRDIMFVNRMITLRSENGPENCIIDCQGSASDKHFGFCFASGQNQYTVVDGFTIKNGYISTKGGGIQCISSSPTIKNCIIRNNSSGDKYDYDNSGGGGIYCRNSNAIFMDCIISDNSTHLWGGGIYCYYGGTVKILNCVITGNRADYVSDMGTFSYGGGIACFDADAEIRNCLIANNWVHEMGGGIQFNRSNSTVSNCTIANNQADEQTGGVRQYLSTVTIENSIIWGNTDPSSEQVRNPFTISYSDIQDGWPGLGNINTDPYFADNDYHLKSQAGRWDPVSQTWVIDSITSLCIDSGNPGCPLGDEPNDVNNVRINMGAYGGTVEASMSPANWRMLPDLDNDATVDYNDLKILIDYWPNVGECLPADLDHSQGVDFIDFAVLGDKWNFAVCLGKAKNPHPKNGQRNVSMHPVLDWSPEERVITYDVYFGTDSNEVNDADIYNPNVYMGNQDVNYWDANNYDSNGLEPYTIFYWRIDEVSVTGITKGDVWSFKTLTSGLDPNLVSLWKFDEGEGTIAYDSVASNDGTLNGVPQWVTGKVGPWALDCDGDGDYVEIPDNDSLTPSSKITVAFWLYNRGGQAAGVYKYASCPDRSPSNTRSYCLQVTTNHIVQLEVFQSASNYDYVESIGEVSLNQWYHVAATFDNGQAVVYIDGQQDNAKMLSVSSIMNDGHPLIIGGYWEYCTPAFVNCLNGQIDDVRIYKQALSAEEIWQLYREWQSKKASNPNPVDKEAGVEPNAVLIWSPGKDALSHDVYFGMDFNEVNDADIYDPNVYMGNQDVNYWDTNNYDSNGLEPDTIFYWRIDEINPGGATKGDVWSFKTRIGGLDPNFVSWWKFDEGTGTIAYDSASNNEGQLMNGPIWTTGNIDGGLSFDGVNDYVDVPDDPSLRFTQNDNFSICAWVNPTSASGWILSKMQTSGKYDLFTYELYWDSANQSFDFVICKSGRNYVVVNTQTGSAPAGSWYHVVCIYENRDMKIYLNGELEGSGYFPYNTGTNTADKNMAIGVRSYGTTKEGYFNGTLDDVRVYNRNLSAEEIALLYQQCL